MEKIIGGNIAYCYILEAKEHLKKCQFDATFQIIQTGLLTDNKNAEL